MKTNQERIGKKERLK